MPHICSHSAVPPQSRAQRDPATCESTPAGGTKGHIHHTELLSGSKRSPTMGGPHHISPHLESGPVPRRIPVRWPLQVSKLDLIGGICAPDLHGELHLQELVRLLPLNLNVVAEGHHHGDLAGRGCTHPSPVHSTQLAPRPDQVQQNHSRA